MPLQIANGATGCIPVILDAKRPMIPVPVPGYELYGAQLNSHKTKFAFLVYVKNKENFLN